MPARGGAELSTEVILRGSCSPLSTPVALRAGPLSALLDGIDLRYVRLGDVELVRRIYVAVRDRNWNTIPGVPSEIEIDRQSDSFGVRFSVRHSSRDVDFRWEGAITGNSDGLITFRMDGRATRTMVYNRIGFCVLHPWREVAGQPFRGESPSGPVAGRLPSLVAPQRYEDGVYVPLFPSVSSLAIGLPDGGEAVFEFDGDLFETEDQRNWADASLKTYCTPLALGFPHELNPGEPKAQGVIVSTRGAPAATMPDDTPKLTVEGASDRCVPALGLGLGGTPALTHGETELLRALAPAHIRCDLHLGDPTWTEVLRAAIRVSRKLLAEIEFALFVSSSADAEADAGLERLRRALADVTLARILVAVEGAQTTSAEETTPTELVERVRERLGLGSVPVAGGTDMYFCELNRSRPQVAGMDGVFWSLTPQVHAFDDLSLLETPEALGEQVRTAHQFADDRPLFVGPVTLRRRYNVNATVDDGGEGAPDALPESVDPRQASLIGAAWTLASAAYLSQEGVSAVTYFETVGWRGVIQGDAGSPRPDHFPTVAGQAFPLFHVLADVAELRGRRLRVCRATRPLEAVALAAQGGNDSVTVLLANLTPGGLAVRIGGLDDRVQRVRRLNMQTAERAMNEPLRFRRLNTIESVAEITLSGYETVRIDSTSETH